MMNRFKPLSYGYLDTKTNLIWCDGTHAAKYNWQDAVELCNSLTMGSHTDCKLPTIQELLLVVDYTKYDPCTRLPKMRLSYYWLSSAYANNSVYAWLVNFVYGLVDYNYKPNPYYVRAVRNASPNHDQLFDDVQNLCAKYDDKQAIVVEMLDCEGMENAVIDELRERGKLIKEI